MINSYKLFYLLISTFLLALDDFSIVSSFGTVNDGDIVYDSPFLGGFNKPKIQWLDWDKDGQDDLFLLDEDGRIKFYSSRKDFSLETTSFLNISNILWFYIADFDDDGLFEIITSNIEDSSLVSYYAIDFDILIYKGNVVDSNGSQISIDPTMVPCFADIDNDGDLDLFSGNVVGTVNYFNNLEISNNIPVFNLETNYWQEIYIVGSSFNQRHGASAINFNDLDQDGDLDLSWGDYFQQSLYVIWNIGDITNPIMDNENILSQFPLNDPIFTAGLNMPSFTDIDLDGDKDLFVTTLSGAYGYQLKNNFTFYENQNENYIKQTSNFISTIDLLSDVNPEFADIDNDGDLDLFIGTDFDPSSFPWIGKINYYENIGLDVNGEILFEKNNNDFLQNNEFSENNLSPSFVDIDNDQDLDLFIGDFNGLIHYFNNIGDINEPIMKYQGHVSNIDLSGYSYPEFVDIDNDHDFDLLIGNMSGTIFYYENIGDKYNYNFILNNESFLDVNVGFRSTVLSLNFNCQSVLIISNGYGEILLYQKNSNSEYVLNEDFSIPYLGLNVSLDYFNTTNHKGLLAGNSTGGFYYLKNNWLGDLNSDQVINVVDIVTLVQSILDEEEYFCHYDLNEDNLVNVSDIIALVNLVLSSSL